MNPIIEALIVQNSHQDKYQIPLCPNSKIKKDFDENQMVKTQNRLNANG